MGQLVLTIAGTVIGNAILPGVGGAIGGAIGGAVGGAVFGPGGTSVQGPRLDDKRITTSSYGVTIPRIYGTARTSGNIIWSTDLKERAETQSSGGKGGDDGVSITTYKYSVSCAISVCLGPIKTIRKIWAEGFLIYDVSSNDVSGEVEVEKVPKFEEYTYYDSETGQPYTETVQVGFEYQITGSGKVVDGPQSRFTARKFRIYTGTEDQQPDPTIQADKGTTPAYRGQSYVVFEDLELETFGNRIPSFTFEVIKGDADTKTWDEVVPSEVVPYGFMAVDPETGYLWQIDESQPATINIVDPYTQTVLATLQGRGDDNYRGLVYVPSTRTFWTVGSYLPITNPLFPRRYIDIWSANTNSIVIESLTSRYDLVGDLDQFFTVYNPDYQKNSLNPLFENGAVIAGSTRGGSNFLVLYSAVDGSEIKFINTNISNSEGGYSEESGVVWVGNGKDLILYSSYDMSVITKIENFGTIHLGDAPKVAYDPTRNRLVWVATFSNQYAIIDLDTFQITYGNLNVPEESGSPNTFIYFPPLDVFVSGDSRSAGQPSTITLYDAESLEPVKTILEEGLTGTITNLVISPAFTDRVFGPKGTSLKYYLSDRYTTATIPLSDIVLAESQIAGLSPSNINVALIEDINVVGYLIASTGSIRSALEPLMVAYQVDAVESGNVIKYVPRALSPTIFINEQDLAVTDFNAPSPEPLALSRKDEVELPRSVTVKYLNFAADYQIGTQASYKLSGQSKNDLVIDIPVVLVDEQAKDLADSILYSAYASRTTTSIQTFIKYANVEPTDLISVKGNTIRVVRKSLAGNIITLEGEFENGAVYVQNSLVPKAFPVNQTIPFIGNTYVEFMDVPMLRDKDNDSGFYVAACGFTQSWPGCGIVKSIDGGDTWVQIATISNASVMGGVESALPAFDSNVFDNVNALIVHLKPGGQLFTASHESIINGANAALVGNEVIQFKTAVQVGTNSYLIGGLLRGRRGTSTQGHVAGERFVLLSEQTLLRINMDISEVGTERLYKAITIGKTFESASTIKFTNAANSLECYSPVKLFGGRDSAGNLKISWFRRTRINGAWRDFVDVSIGEDSESYSVEIYDNGTLMRTINSTSTNVTYSAADQITDFGSPQSSVSVIVYQNSSINGPGFTISGSV
jgi:hypothetical protein